MPMQIVKILFVDIDCDEKLCSRILEDATAEFRNHNIYCVFTVVCNGFVALECFEHTQYDLLLIDKNLTDNLDGSTLIRIIRGNGSEAPAVMLIPAKDGGGETAEFFQSTMFKPFSVNQLLTCISSALNLAIIFPSIATEASIDGSEAVNLKSSGI